jgi:predicted O-linked N-acetylglucosamine transferase (SPINDLY family)
MLASADTAPAPLPAASRLEEGMALRAQGRHEEAVAEFRAVLVLEPNLAEAHHQLGNALKSLHRYAEAVASLRAAALLAPQSGAVWLNLGVGCLELSRLDEAVACFRRAIRLEPTRPEAHNILGHALLAKGRCTAAKHCLEEALRLRPGYPAAHDNLGRVLKTQGLAAQALAHHRAALAAAPRPEIHSNLLFSLNFPADISAEEIFAEHRQWAERYAGGASGRAACPPKPGEGGQPPGPTSEERLTTSGAVEAGARRLRVGYVSPDFVNHAVAYFFEPVLAAHDRGRFEIFCYSNVRVPDKVTERLRGQSDAWREIAGLSDDQVAALVREDQIDILVDLAGHTARNRLLVFARRPAPVQATWLGYPNTTGLDAIDYRLTEAVSDPAGSEAWHSEKLWRLPETFSCYRPSAESPLVGPLPAAAAGYITFGCFNHLAKLTPPAIKLWAEVLRDLPGSRLFLKSRGLADLETAARVREEFARHGIEAARLELNGEELSVARHLALYDRVDIALDPFPYNGTTTTCEALWMGVPVVTLAGRTHGARVGASLLTHLGAAHWIADTPAQYGTRCRELASDLTALAAVRAALRECMRGSLLCDAPRFTRHLENGFREMWEKQVGG